MESIRLAFVSIIASIRSLTLDHNNAFATLVAKLNLLALRKAEKSQVDAIETDVTLVKSSLNTVIADVADVKTTVAASEAKVDAMGVRVDTVETSLVTLTTTVTGVEASVTDLSTRVIAAEATVATVVSDVELVKTDVVAVKADVATVLVDLATVKQMIADSGTREFEYLQESTDPADIATVLATKAVELGVSLVNQQYALNCAVGTAFTYSDVDGNVVVLEMMEGGRLIANYKDGVVASVIAVPTVSGGVSPIVVDTTVPVPTGASSLTGLSPYFN
jgi:archaellum component FlaC